jgi:hypothetical protein
MYRAYCWGSNFGRFAGITCCGRQKQGCSLSLPGSGDKRKPDASGTARKQYCEDRLKNLGRISMARVNPERRTFCGRLNALRARIPVLLHRMSQASTQKVTKVAHRRTEDHKGSFNPERRINREISVCFCVPWCPPRGKIRHLAARLERRSEWRH